MSVPLLSSSWPSMSSLELSRDVVSHQDGPQHNYTSVLVREGDTQSEGGQPCTLAPLSQHPRTCHWCYGRLLHHHHQQQQSQLCVSPCNTI